MRRMPHAAQISEDVTKYLFLNLSKQIDHQHITTHHHRLRQSEAAAGAVETAPRVVKCEVFQYSKAITVLSYCLHLTVSSGGDTPGRRLKATG